MSVVFIDVHRVSYLIARGPVTPGLVLHHACERTSCVEPTHLVPMKQAEHRVLHGSAYRGKASAHRGVSFHKGRQKWRADVKRGGVAKWLGAFETEAAAVDAVARYEHSIGWSR
jgi:hypothetical protein